jgi:hypothetical protein
MDHPRQCTRRVSATREPEYADAIACRVWEMSGSVRGLDIQHMTSQFCIKNSYPSLIQNSYQLYRPDEQSNKADMTYWSKVS